MQNECSLYPCVFMPVAFNAWWSCVMKDCLVIWNVGWWKADLGQLVKLPDNASLPIWGIDWYPLCPHTNCPLSKLFHLWWPEKYYSHDGIGFACESIATSPMVRCLSLLHDILRKLTTLCVRRQNRLWYMLKNFCLLIKFGESSLWGQAPTDGSFPKGCGNPEWCVSDMLLTSMTWW